ncbi:MAG: bifunctional nicotinamidase/pyrazinamidase [Fusobacterium perfoetens]|uniref:bifunctional nicotinamidase/pyrazinamidase n=1 Tax=Fusobacterium perfoetens TaxID=852 RepID=UPI0023F4FA1E|nr:bifunctional nicotinamidase/pyrazinamidase [Fusobacterium perfoetens]MCI6152408.1 bifunctional nicotinamidase/pyrazinamidase [Fusobacterium perfoetens]MDY3237007.1 bifunctional nicotinamidase/pyrazinamidase [Fusobacterium perfoetens]
MKALLLIDLQNDFCKNGALEVKDGDKVIFVGNLLMEKFKNSNNMILATKDWHPITHKSFASNSDGKIGELGILNGLPQVWWPNHCVENTKGSEFHPNLNSKYIDKIIFKGTNKEIDSYSGFFDNGKLNKTELDSILKKNNIDTLYIMGLATDFCVKFTVLDALQLGYKVYLVEDGCRGVNLTPNSSLDAINEMKEKGAIIINSSEIL